MAQLFPNFLLLAERQRVSRELEKDTQAECQLETQHFLGEWQENQHQKIRCDKHAITN